MHYKALKANKCFNLKMSNVNTNMIIQAWSKFTPAGAIWSLDGQLQRTQAPEREGDFLVFSHLGPFSLDIPIGNSTS